MGSLLFLEMILSEVDPEGGATSLLDIGCGDGTLSAALQQRIRSVVGVDVDANAIIEARTHCRENAGLKFLLGNVEDLTATISPCEQFDCVVAIFSLHHVNVDLVLEQARRLVRIGGRLLVIDIFADVKKSFFAYFFDQFVFSFIRHPSGIWNAIRSLGFTRTIRYLKWRLTFTLSANGREHVRQDLSRESPMRLDQWMAILGKDFPSGTAKVFIGSTLVFSWQKN